MEISNIMLRYTIKQPRHGVRADQHQFPSHVLENVPNSICLPSASVCALSLSVCWYLCVCVAQKKRVFSFISLAHAHGLSGQHEPYHLSTTELYVIFITFSAFAPCLLYTRETNKTLAGSMVILIRTYGRQSAQMKHSWKSVPLFLHVSIHLTTSYVEISQKR